MNWYSFYKYNTKFTVVYSSLCSVKMKLNICIGVCLSQQVDDCWKGWDSVISVLYLLDRDVHWMVTAVVMKYSMIAFCSVMCMDFVYYQDFVHYQYFVK